MTKMRRLARFTALAAALLSQVSCSADAPTSSAATGAASRIGLSPAFSAAAAQTYTALAAFGIEVTNVHVRLTAEDGSVRDTTVQFPALSETLSIELSVPARTAGQSFVADVELRNSDGIVLFSGRQAVVAQTVAFGVPGKAPTTVTIAYSGPGVAVRSISVSPGNPRISGVQSVDLSVIGADQNGANVSDVLVRWTTSDASIATVTQTGNKTATVTTTGKRGTVTISAITPTNVTGAATINVTPVATKLAVISGGGQTGAAGSTLPQPFIVEVQGADNLPVGPGTVVTFRAVTSGASVGTTTVPVDANGRAQTTMTLGRAAGAYQFEAASGSFAAVTVSGTATAAPAALITLVSGSGQSGAVGTSLAQPLIVRVVDQFGANVSGATVQWTQSGAGSLGSSSSTTDANGLAANTYKLGSSIATETVTATLPGVTGASGSVTFSFRATAGAPARISGAGGGQHGTAGTVLSNPLVVLVVDASGNPVANAAVSWVTAGPSSATVSFSPASGVTDANGFAQSTVTLGGQPGSVTAAVLVQGGLTFTYPLTVDAGGGGTTVGNPGILSGFVYNAVTQSALSGVQVIVRSGTSVVATTQTNSSGNYATSSLPGGTYDVSVVLLGYNSTSISSLVINGNTQAEAVPLVPASGTPGSISGSVLDATNGQPVTNGATVELRSGLNNVTGSLIQSVTANSSGQYIFSNVSSGTYTVLVHALGYADAFKTGISVGATTTGGQNVFVSPTGSAGTVRIVLTWRTAPRDLDSYLTGPIANSTSRFTVYYGSRGSCTSSPLACLDRDVTSGSGPETMTISQVLPGTYRYTVDNYSGELPLEQSGARVDLYIDGTLRQSFSVPAGTGRDWAVFELNGNTVTTINVIQNGVNLMTRGAGLMAPSRTGSDAALIDQLKNVHPKRHAVPR